MTDNWVYVLYFLGGLIGIAGVICLCLALGAMLMVVWRFYMSKQLSALEKRSEVLKEQKTHRSDDDTKARIKSLELELSAAQSTVSLKDRLFVAVEENVEGRGREIAKGKLEVESVKARLEKLLQDHQALGTKWKALELEMGQLHQENDNLHSANTMLQKQSDAQEKKTVMLSATVTDLNHVRDTALAEVKALKEQVRLLQQLTDSK